MRVLRTSVCRSEIMLGLESVRMPVPGFSLVALSKSCGVCE